MKKILGLITIIMLVSTLGYLVYQITTKVNAKQKAELHIAQLPAFRLQTLQGTMFSNNDLPQNVPTICIFFNSTCDFCQHEAQSIHDHLDQFTNVQFVFISDESLDTIRNFATTYQLNTQTNITFLHDRNSLFSTQLDIQSIPTLLIYNSARQLLKKHTGQLNANGISKIINNL